jgi:subtilisin family serine protease
VLAVMLAIQPVPAGAVDPASGSGPAYAPTTGAGGHTYPVTLITGDLVMLHVAPDGSQATWLAESATDRPTPPPRIIQLDGQVHVIPAEAEPYLASGVLDDRLFNVTALVRHGLDDTSRSDLALLLVSPEGPQAAGAQEVPTGAREVRHLDSIDAVSVKVDRGRMRQFWESLRGPRPAAPGSDDATLAGADRVWLNGRVETMLGDSVPHVGTPVAWEAGFDGSGATVAVLDTGYDADHPDLAGQVAGAHDFTGAGDATDGNGHGTHVAATIAGTGAASGGTRTGVAPGADLLIGKVLDDSGSGFEDWVISGMEWAVEQDTDVVNMSLGTPWPSDGTDPLSQAVDRLTESSGVLFVVAAGNSGPFGQSIGSPGAATRALTVGATGKDDSPAAFSSRGPRFGDDAIKPEIVAPGVEIVAARAGGTSLGNLIDRHHTSLSGTSMATPHVAGAAAILAQQHSGWDADEIKARLTATSAPLAGQPVTFQGAGRLDVAAAVGTPVTVDRGVLSLGRVEQGADLVVRTLTYRNTAEEPVTLRLSTDVTSTGSRSGLAPDLRVRPAGLVIPAGGEAEVEVTLSPRSSRPGGYAGWITAEDLRGPSPAVRTVLSVTVDGPLHTITVTGVDREGDPASGRVQLWNADTGEDSFGFMHDGEVALQVPAGVYAMVTSLETMEGGMWPPASYTIAGDPELTVRKDLELAYDARDAEPVRVTTPRKAGVSYFDVTWYREVGDRSVSASAAQGITGTERLYTMPSRTARTGSFELSTSWQLPQPLMTVRFDRPDGDRAELTPTLASPRNAYAGQVSLPVVDVGTGTPEEFADVDVAGKVALVARHGEWGQLREQTVAARDAGAALVLAYNTMPGAWLEEVWNAPLPAYTMGQAAGTALRQAIAADPDLAVDLSAVSDSTYTYQLFFTETGAVPGGRDYRAADHPMAVVQSDYRQNSERMGRNEMWIPYPDSGALPIGNSISRNGPTQRTEYVSTEGVRWQRFAQPHEFLGYYWTWSPIQRYRPGETYRQLWWGPLTRPGVPELAGAEQYGLPVARFHDAIRIVLLPYLYGDGPQYGSISDTFGDTAQLTLRGGDGEVIGTARWPEAQFTVPPDESWYELQLEIVNGSGNWMDTSVRSESTWRFPSARPDRDREVLPLVQVGYQLDTDLYNRVPAGTGYDLVVVPGYQPQADGPGGFTVTVDVSYDDGTTWSEAPVETADGTHTARVPAAPAHAGFATVRVVATDADGNQLTQLIERAWRVD